MKLRLKKFEVNAGRSIIFLNEEDALNADISVGERVIAEYHGKKIVARVDIVKNFIDKGEIALTEDAKKFISAKVGNELEIQFVTRPDSAVLITKKMQGGKLSTEEYFKIIKDIVENILTEAEIAEFVVAVYKNGMHKEETYSLTEAMYKSGTVLSWKNEIVADKHCIGGIAGNRTTPIVVSICAAAGLLVPKTSSRAITSAAGTADVIEVLANVSFSAAELKRIVEKTGACLAWGGSLGLSPADDKLIKIERILKLDPKAQLLASIFSKKLSVGSTHLLIDIPYGPGAKVSKKEALKLSNSFKDLAKHFKMKIKVVLTDGNQPIGNGIGPVLEILDVLKVLERQKNAPLDLETKSLILAGELLELAGKTKKGKGFDMAQDILNSKAALTKFKEIIREQGERKRPLSPAKENKTILAEKNFKIKAIDNKKINTLAITLGCPIDKYAGIYLYHHVGDTVKKGDPLFEMYSESTDKLHEAVLEYAYLKPIA